MVVMCFVRLNREWVQRLGLQGAAAEEMLHGQNVAWVEELNTEDAELGALATSQLALLSQPGFESIGVARTAWERFTVEHFEGRLLPGCCNLGCTNLAGISESTLKTLLCSGCRRARYCTVGCQRAAWLEGGHCSVCKPTIA